MSLKISSLDIFSRDLHISFSIENPNENTRIGNSGNKIVAILYIFACKRTPFHDLRVMIKIK